MSLIIHPNFGYSPKFGEEEQRKLRYRKRLLRLLGPAYANETFPVYYSYLTATSKSRHGNHCKPTLPLDVLLVVLSFVSDYKTLVAISQVSKSFHMLASMNVFWLQLCVRDFGTKVIRNQKTIHPTICFFYEPNMIPEIIPQQMYEQELARCLRYESENKKRTDINNLPSQLYYPHQGLGLKKIAPIPRAKYLYRDLRMSLLRVFRSQYGRNVRGMMDGTSRSGTHMNCRMYHRILRRNRNRAGLPVGEMSMANVLPSGANRRGSPERLGRRYSRRY